MPEAIRCHGGAVALYRDAESEVVRPVGLAPVRVHFACLDGLGGCGGDLEKEFSTSLV